MFLSYQKPKRLDYLARINSDSGLDHLQPLEVNHRNFLKNNNIKLSTSVILKERKIDKIVSRMGEKLKNYRNSKILNYEPINRIKEKDRVKTNQDNKNNKINEFTEKRLTTQIYNSIENNLEECDKILIKLQHKSLENSVHLRNSIKNNQTSIFKNFKPQNTVINNNRIHLSINSMAFDRRLNKIASPLVNRSQSYTPQLSQQIKQYSKTINCQDQRLLVDLKRQKIQEILNARKSLAEKSIEHSLQHLKVRGQKMVNKFSKIRQSPLDKHTESIH